MTFSSGSCEFPRLYDCHSDAHDEEDDDAEEVDDDDEEEDPWNFDFC